MIPDNQLARRTQYKRDRGLGGSSRWRAKSPYKPRGLGGGSPLAQIFFYRIFFSTKKNLRIIWKVCKGIFIKIRQKKNFLRFWWTFFAYVRYDSKSTISFFIYIFSFFFSFPYNLLERWQIWVHFSSRNSKLTFLLNEIFFFKWKIIFAYVSEHCASFRTKNSIWPLMRGEEGVCMSLTKNNPRNWNNLQ